MSLCPDAPMPVGGNLFRPLPDACAGERFDDLLTRPGCRIERIVSRGQASPPGFWYDQDWDEWVLLLAGSAELRLEERAEPIRLGVGDYLLIPAGQRHRVEATDPAVATVWLAVHMPRAERG